MKKINIRKELIDDKIKNIRDSLGIIEENLPDSLESFMQIGLIKDGIYKKIEFLIESIVDICAIINSDLNLGSPETEDSIIEHLERKKIFSKKTVSLIQEMKKFRNILVHRYGKINDAQAFETIKEGLDDFEVIVGEIEAFLKKY